MTPMTPLCSKQQQFMDWVENHIADALGYPVFSIGQEILFEWDNQIQLAVIDSYVISTDINGELNIQYLIVLIEDNYYWGDVQSHDELLKLNPIANNLPTSRKHCNDC
ncbi:MAG: hypothetical protein VKK42_07785 [Lyngbya sp.]|nr:hypothetical protein [Lyngbya sp.]